VTIWAGFTYAAEEGGAVVLTGDGLLTKADISEEVAEREESVMVSVIKTYKRD
jgi:hypothetical protein